MPKLIATYYLVRKIVSISKLSISDQCIWLASHAITTKEQFSRVIRPTEKDMCITKKIVRFMVDAKPRISCTGPFKELEMLPVSCQCDFINKLHCK